MTAASASIADPLGDFAKRRFAGVVVTTLNHLLRDQDWARRKLAPHANKVVRLCVQPINIALSITADGLVGAPDHSDLPAAVTITVPITNLPQLLIAGLTNDLSTAAVRASRVEGDAELAAVVAELAQHLRWEAEEDLSAIVGDAAAHRLVGFGRAAVGQMKASARRMTDNTVDYLTDEQPVLISRDALVALSADVKTLREDSDRIAKRVERLMRTRA